MEGRDTGAAPSLRCSPSVVSPDWAGGQRLSTALLSDVVLQFRELLLPCKQLVEMEGR